MIAAVQQPVSSLMHTGSSDHTQTPPPPTRPQAPSPSASVTPHASWSAASMATQQNPPPSMGGPASIGPASGISGMSGVPASRGGGPASLACAPASKAGTSGKSPASVALVSSPHATLSRAKTQRQRSEAFIGTILSYELTVACSSAAAMHTEPCVSCFSFAVSPRAQPKPRHSPRDSRTRVRRTTEVMKPCRSASSSTAVR